MVWLPDGEKFLKICLFVSTEFTNVTDRLTDRHTLHDDIGLAYALHSIARQKLQFTGGSSCCTVRVNPAC